MRMQIKSRLCRTRKLNFLNNIVLCCELENGVFSLRIYFSIVFFFISLFVYLFVKELVNKPLEIT